MFSHKLRSVLSATSVGQWSEDCKDVASIRAGGPIVDEFFLTVPGSNFDMCMNSTRDSIHIHPLQILFYRAENVCVFVRT